MKICFIITFYGKWPPWMPLFLKSCSYNPQINWLLVTDLEWEDLPENVCLHREVIGDLVVRIQSKIGISVVELKPYKLCDYKPAFGVLFDDLLEGYDFWGHCDLDVAFGNLAHFIDDETLAKTDIYSPFNRSCGHFQLYRNCEKVNTLFLQINGIEKLLGYEGTFGLDEPFFDEVLVNEQERVRWQRHASMTNELSKEQVEMGATIEAAGGLRGDSNSESVDHYVWDRGRVFQQRKGKKKEFLYLHWYRWKDEDIWKQTMENLVKDGRGVLNTLVFAEKVPAKINESSIRYKLKMIILKVLSHLPFERSYWVRHARCYIWRKKQECKMAQHFKIYV